MYDEQHSSMLLKGKLTNRSWAQLPEEVIRLITTHYLWDISVTNYCPTTWDTRKLWPSKMVYMTIRDALDIEKHLMLVCPEWSRAIAKHTFWKQAIHLIDCNDTLTHHMVIHPKLPLNVTSSNALPRTIYLSPYQHFRNIISCSCYVCRINYPYSNMGLTSAKRLLTGSRLGPGVFVCREHDRRRAFFCGLCLRDTIVANPHENNSRDYELTQQVGIMENEDEKMWEGVESTCRKCRLEALWREAGKIPGDREAIGGPTLQSHDWETRQCVEGFVELAEGSIGEVLTTAREKVWLKRFTKYEDFGQHALMAQRTNREEQEEEEEDDSEEDRELMLMRDVGQVRDLALHDWARRRILDGHWLSPADLWYHYQNPGQPLVVPAIHPCPWNQESISEEDASDDQQHPRMAIVNSPIPPTFSLCEQAYAAHMKQIREILAHPLRNLVRKIIMECEIPGPKGYEDPAIKASRMSIEEVVRVLREEEGIWYDGVDWVERRRNEEETETARRRAALCVEGETAMRLDDDIKDHAEHDHDLLRQRKEDDVYSTTSSGSSPSGSSHAGSAKYSEADATSPVLSTTTLQTTPSPPPLTDDGAEKKEEEDESTPHMLDSQQTELGGYPLSPPSRPRIIPVDPVKSTPTPLSSIPYIPVTTAHLPQYSLEAIKQVWRDVCAPLYHCRCSICERAKMADIAARAAYAALNAPGGVVPSQPQQQPPLTSSVPDTAEIVLKGTDGDIELDGDGDGEGEEEVEDADFDEYDDDDDDLDGDEDDERYTDEQDDGVEGDGTYRYASMSPEVELLDATSNSNSSSGHPVSNTASTLSSSVHSDTNSNLSGHSGDTRTSRKRSSDELEEDEEGNEVGFGDAGYDSISGDSASVSSGEYRRRPGGTPPKRARIGERELEMGSVTAGNITTTVTTAAAAPASPFMGVVFPPTTATPTVTVPLGPGAAMSGFPAPSATISRARKRSSEELSADDSGAPTAGTLDGPLVSSKRVKVDLERPRSLTNPTVPSAVQSVGFANNSVGVGSVVGMEDK